VSGGDENIAKTELPACVCTLPHKSQRCSHNSLTRLGEKELRVSTKNTAASVAISADTLAHSTSCQPIEPTPCGQSPDQRAPRSCMTQQTLTPTCVFPEPGEPAISVTSPVLKPPPNITSKLAPHHFQHHGHNAIKAHSTNGRTSCIPTK